MSGARDGFVQANGMRLHYVEWGDETSPPMVMLHANGFLARLWEPVVTAPVGPDGGTLADRRRVIAYDMRGQGDSDKPEREYHWQFLVDDLRGFLDAFGLNPGGHPGGRGVPLVGHSSGGAAAAYLAATHPEYVSKLCLIEPIIQPPEFAAVSGPREAMAAGARKRRQLWDSHHALFEAYRKRETFARWREDLLHMYAEHGMFRREDGHYQLKCSGEVEAQMFENSVSLDIWGALPDVRCPALVMRGEYTDAFLGGIVEKVAGRIPDGRFLTIAGAGHLAPMEQPEAVAHEILGFLSG